MDATITEIAVLLRSTEEMATQFVQLVQTHVGQPVSKSEILAAIQKIPAKSLSMKKVVTKVQQQQKVASRRTTRRRAVRQPSQKAPEPQRVAENNTTTASSPSASRKETKTLLERLALVLLENWDRAETEGLQPKRMSAEAFVNAIYQYTDRREGTRRRIFQAARKLDQTDVMLTPALVADTVHQLFEG